MFLRVNLIVMFYACKFRVFVEFLKARQMHSKYTGKHTLTDFSEAEICQTDVFCHFAAFLISKAKETLVVCV